MKAPITHLLHDIDGPDTHITRHDYSWPMDILRLSPDAQVLKIEVDVLIDENEPRYYGVVRQQINLSNGLAIQADSVIMFTKDELETIGASDELRDYIREGLEYDAEMQAEAHHRHTELVRELRSYGLIR